VVLVPVPFDATTSFRQGAALCPFLIREASLQVDLWDGETGDPWSEGIAMLEEDDFIAKCNEKAWKWLRKSEEGRDEEDARDVLSTKAIVARARNYGKAVDRVNAIGEKVVAWVYREVRTWLDRGKLVGVVGGDHSSPLGAIMAIAERYPGLGVLHIDAHADLREAYQGFVHSHASIMHNVLARVPGVARITQVGLRDLCANERDVIRTNDRVRSFFDFDMARSLFEGTTFASLTREMVETLPSNVYVSFDIDGLDPSLCPGTGTPVPGGLSFQQASYLLAEVVRSGRRIVGFDLCEVAPSVRGMGTDGIGTGTIDGIVGARMLYKLVGWAVRSSPSAGANG